MNEDKRQRPKTDSLEQQQSNQERLQASAETITDLAGSKLADPMPQIYIDWWNLYLDDVDGGRLPTQTSYHCWCEDCWQAEEKGDKDADEPEVLAANTEEVRSFIHLHEGHDVTLMLECVQEFADLEQRARTILLRDAIYRRHWVATMSDQELQELSGVGPKLFKHIREQVPYSGPPEAEGNSPQWERCPTCYGTGLKLSDVPLTAVAQRVHDLEEEAYAAKGNALQPVPSIEESLMQLTSAIQEINSRLAVLEKDRKEGLSAPRILMSLDVAARAVGVRQSVIWDAVMEGDLPFVRMVKGLPMVRSEALQEWLKWREMRMEREPEPYVTPPELLCRKCGERPYDGRSAQLNLCQECHQLLRQERIDEKEKKRTERLSRKKHSNQP